MILGILAGLMMAVCQSLSYLFSRRYVIRAGHNNRELVALAHVWMGVMALAIVPFLWSPAAPPLTSILCPLVGTAVFYLLGQVGLFSALRRTDASRVSPLLGLKILILAGITAVGFHAPALRDLLLLKPVTILQWVAVVASVGAALMLNEAGGRLTAGAAAGILCTCVGYSLSDLSIGVLVERLAVMGKLRGAMYGCCLTYLLTAVIGLAVMPRGCVRVPAKWRLALPVAVFWLLAMFFLYLTFKMIGVLFGNIVQATRGLFSIGLGALVAHWQLHHLESKVPRDVLWRRVAAAVLMFLAIAAFLLSRNLGK